MSMRGMILLSFGEVRVYFPTEKIVKLNGRSTIVTTGTYKALPEGAAITLETAENIARKIAGDSLDGTVYRSTGALPDNDGFGIVGEFHDPVQPTIPVKADAPKDPPAKDPAKK